MDSWYVIRDMVVLLTAALLMGLVFQRLRQSAIVGCLVAGTLVGPSVLGWVPGEETQQIDALSQIAELGVAMLLFSIGLEVSWKRFASFGLVAVGGGTLQVVITALVTAGAAMLMGATWQAAVALGSIVSLSSTSTVLRVLSDRGEVDSVHGRAALGILLMQDILVVPLVLVVTFAGGRQGLSDVIAALGKEAGRGALLVIAIMLTANLVVPRVMHLTALLRDREFPVVLAVVTWLAATWSAHMLGLSPALGAFIAGMILAGSPFAAQIRADVAPFRIVFVTLFFASLGLLADLRWLIQPVNFISVIGLAAAIIVGKAIIVWAIVRPMGRTNVAALATGTALSNIGEFSFVLAAIAHGNGVLDDNIFQLVVSVTLLTLLATPPLVTHAQTISERVERLMILAGLWRASSATVLSPREPLAGHMIVVGYGPSGQAVAEALHDAELEVVVVDLNPRLLAKAVADGRIAALMDATRRETLEHLDVEEASGIVVTVPDYRAARLVIEQTRSLAPHLPILARARYHAFAEQLREAGASVVVDEEHAVGRRLGQEAVAAASVQTTQAAASATARSSIPRESSI